MRREWRDPPPRQETAFARDAGKSSGAEVEQRIARQREQLARSGERTDRPPYLLLLVRPDGVESYHGVQRALQSVNVDFGYEFIDADWVLDFPNDDKAPAAQPWMTAQGVDSGKLVPTPGKVVTGPGGSWKAERTVVPERPTRPGYGGGSATRGGSEQVALGTGIGGTGSGGYGLPGNPGIGSTGPGGSSPGGTGPIVGLPGDGGPGGGSGSASSQIGKDVGIGSPSPGGKGVGTGQGARRPRLARRV